MSVSVLLVNYNVQLIQSMKYPHKFKMSKKQQHCIKYYLHEWFF